MPSFETARRVAFTPEQMFALVADVERYPEFLPLCESLRVRSRESRNGRTLLVADMTVGYKAIREAFSSRVVLDPGERVIEVSALDGPFRRLINRWHFEPAPGGGATVRFLVDYEFKSRMLAVLMGAVFDKAVRRFADAFEARAAALYGAASAA